MSELWLPVGGLFAHGLIAVAKPISAKVLWSLGLNLLGFALACVVVYFILRVLRRRDLDGIRERAQQIQEALSGYAFSPATGDEIQILYVMRKTQLGEDRLPHLIQNRFTAPPIEGRSMELMDFAYSVYSRPRQQGVAQPIWQTIAVISNDEWNFPRFAATPHGFWHFDALRLGSGDINFDSHPRYSRMFKLQSEDEAAARSIFKPEVLEALQQHRGLSTEGVGHSLIFYYRRQQLKPAAFPGFQDDVRKLAQLFRR